MKISTAFQTDPTFPKQIDLESILPFISQIPNYNYLIPSSNNYFKAVFSKAKEEISIRKRQLDIFKAETISTEKLIHIKIRMKRFIDTERTDEYRKLVFLHDIQNEYRAKVVKIREEVENKISKLISDLFILCDWFISNPQPYFIDVARALPSEMLLLYHSDRDINFLKNYHSLKYAAKEQYDYVKILPEVFYVNEQNRLFLRNCVDTALQQKKADTCYFEPISVEDSLFVFFLSSSSPIQNLVSIEKIGDRPDSVLNWIRICTNLLYEFEKTNDEERKVIIGVFLTRFVFDYCFPKLSYSSCFIEMDSNDDKSRETNNFKFAKKTEKMREMTPKALGVVLKYIPTSSENDQCHKIFEYDSISMAPIEWFRSAEFKVCPIDAAYCIFKVHESLSIMATLNAANNANKDEKIGESQKIDILPTDSKNFFEKLPGFDDIFAIWICLLCSADVSDALAMNEFISKWSKLPGFSSRFIACCTYLEAAITHILMFGEEEEEETEKIKD